jgi:hypothetical protein
MTISTLYDASRLGLPIVCGNRDRLGEVPASDIRDLILGRSSSISPFGVRIHWAHITSKLDLSNTVIPFPLHFINCEFTDELAIEAADSAGAAYSSINASWPDRQWGANASRPIAVWLNYHRRLHDIVIASALGGSLAHRIDYRWSAAGRCDKNRHRCRSSNPGRSKQGNWRCASRSRFHGYR